MVGRKSIPFGKPRPFVRHRVSPPPPFTDRLEMTMASLNSLRQFWRKAVRPPLVMTALFPWRWWKRRSLPEATEDGLLGDSWLFPSERSSGSGRRSGRKRVRASPPLLFKSPPLEDHPVHTHTHPHTRRSPRTQPRVNGRIAQLKSWPIRNRTAREPGGVSKYLNS